MPRHRRRTVVDVLRAIGAETTPPERNSTMTYLSPVTRQWLYNIVTALVPILIVYGVVDANTAPLWIALAATVLGTGTAALALFQQRRDGTLDK